MSNWIVQILIKGVLNWLKGLWDSFIQKQKHIEQGRKQVLDALEKKDKEVDEELQKLRDSSPTFDDAINELRSRSNSRRN